MKTTTRLTVGPNEPVVLVQFTDTHIFADPDEKFDGIDTAETFKRVIEHTRTQDWTPHMGLVTGDLVHDPVIEAYERFHELIDKLQIPVCCLPGNHDDPVLMQKYFNTGAISDTKIITAGNWLILLLDSWMPGTHSGHLQNDELVWLDNMLKTQSQRHVLVCLHHHPVSVDSPWMDSMALDNPDEFFTMLDQYERVRAVLWGHIHQEYTSIRKGVALYGTPSTCVQFTPRSTEYRKNDIPPACRWLILEPAGGISTQVSYAGAD
jgi:Icc protein